MAITIKDSPQIFNPAFNPNYWVLDSTKKNNNSFRYVIEVVINTVTIATYKIRPVPITGYGVIDIQKILQAQFGKDVNLIQYSLATKEEYILNVLFSDYSFGGSVWSGFSDPSINPNGGAKTMLKHGSTQPSYSIGDVITVQQNASSNFRASLEGIHTVLDVEEINNIWYTILNISWIGSGGTSSGTTFYTDGRNTIDDSITINGFRSFRGAVGFKDYIDYDGADYTIALNQPRLLLTTLPEKVRLSKKTQSKLAFYNSQITNPLVEYQTNLGKFRYSTSGAAPNISYANSFPENSFITEWFTNGAWTNQNIPTIDPSELIYSDVRIMVSDTIFLSKTYRINYYDECDFHDTYDIHFLDRLGSLITIPFYKGAYISQVVDKKTFTNKYGNVTNDTWKYDAKERGITTYSSEEKLTYTVNSGQLSQVESQYMKELISSPEVYVSINGGDLEAIQIVSSNIPLHLKRTERDRKYSIKFVKSVQDNINS